MLKGYVGRKRLGTPDLVCSKGIEKVWKIVF